jgi:AcrR family transcriptional regulator
VCTVTEKSAGRDQDTPTGTDADGRPQKLDRRPREERRRQVLEAAREAIAEVGLADLRLAHVAERAGMSTGHVLYYFGTRDRILAEVLKWSEAELAERRSTEMTSLSSAPARLWRFVDLYVATRHDDPAWTLWLDVMTSAARDREIAQLAGAIVRDWQNDLERIVREGIAAGVFRPVDPRSFTEWFLSLMDGLSLQIVCRQLDLDRRRAIELCCSLASSWLDIQDTDRPHDRRCGPGAASQDIASD